MDMFLSESDFAIVSGVTQGLIARQVKARQLSRGTSGMDTGNLVNRIFLTLHRENLWAQMAVGLVEMPGVPRGWRLYGAPRSDGYSFVPVLAVPEKMELAPWSIFFVPRERVRSDEAGTFYLESNGEWTPLTVYRHTKSPGTNLA